MDERGAATWDVEGRPISIDRTYFEAEGSKLSFVVEWGCEECRPDHRLTEAEALELARPVLRAAIARGEATRTGATKMGARPLETTRLVSHMWYRLGQSKRLANLVVDQPDLLYDWHLRAGDRTYHLFQPGYYVDTGTGRLYFTIQWHEPSLCPGYEDLTDESATKLTLPVMQEILQHKLYDAVPIVGAPPEHANREVDAIGVAISCPDPRCAGQPGCPTNGRRTSLPLEEIRAAGVEP